MQKFACNFTNFSCLYLVCILLDRVCIDIHETRNTKHDVFVYRVPNSTVHVLVLYSVSQYCSVHELHSVQCTHTLSTTQHVLVLLSFTAIFTHRHAHYFLKLK